MCDDSESIVTNRIIFNTEPIIIGYVLSFLLFFSLGRRQKKRHVEYNMIYVGFYTFFFPFDFSPQGNAAAFKAITIVNGLSTNLVGLGNRTSAADLRIVNI